MNQELINFNLTLQRFILCGLFSKPVILSTMILYFISIISTPLFLIEETNLKHPFFPKSQQVIGKNEKNKKGLSTSIIYASVPA